MSKYKDQLQELRRSAEKLPADVTMLGWFGRATPDDRYVPVDRLYCVSISRSFFPREYRLQKMKTQPALVSVAPVIWQDGVLHVGGTGWWQHIRHGEVVYTRKPVNEARPVGVLRDVFDNDPRSPVHFRPDAPTPVGIFDRKIIQWTRQLLDEHSTQAKPGSGRWGDTNVIPPSFFCPALRTHPLRLRHGPALERIIRHCAEYGQWAIQEDAAKVGELRASVRGLARRTDESSIHFIGDDPEQGTLEDHYSAYRASTQLEHLISEVFHVDMGVSLVPLVSSGGTRVREGQSLFGPVPKGVLPEGDLQDHSAYPAMAYMAALTTLRAVDGVPRIDCSTIIGADVHKPVALFDGIEGRVQRLPNRARALRLQNEGISFDMSRLSVREVMRARSEERKRQSLAAQLVQVTKEEAVRVAAESEKESS
jgi:hypothetical protein